MGKLRLDRCNVSARMARQVPISLGGVSRTGTWNAQQAGERLKRQDATGVGKETRKTKSGTEDVDTLGELRPT